MKRTAALKIVGKAARRLDAREKVTGKALYTSDVQIAGMAHGKILRSPLAHARVLSISTERAERHPGVVAVLTRADLKDFALFGAAYKDQPIVALDKVRYAGDPVAAVAAENEAAAQEALSLIEVEFEELPAVTNLKEALESGAVLVHDAGSAGGELQGYRYEAPKGFHRTNVCYRFGYARGDVESGFEKSAYVFEDTFTFPRVQHFSMEPHATVARFADGRLTVWASTQDPFTLRQHLSGIFHLPLNKVRVIVPYLGAGYGGKLSVKNEPVAAALSWKARCPVKVVNTVEESFKTVSRHSARCRLKTGVAEDGRLQARHCEIYMDTGAYADAGPRVTQKAGYRAPGPYRIPHAKTDAYTVYTNTVPAGAFRGFGSIQVTWAYESQMDLIARRMGLDPYEFRRKNLLKKGEIYTAGDTPVDCDLAGGLAQAAKRIGWKRTSSGSHTGKGLSCCMKDGGGTYKVSSALVKMAFDGSIILSTGTVEAGQGAYTALSQVVAEELGVPLERIEMAELDTDVTPYDSATNASSSMVVMGLCVQRAAQDLKKQLLRAAAKVLKSVPGRLALQDGKVCTRNGQSVPYDEVLIKYFGAKAGELVGQGFYQDKKSTRAVLGSPTTFWEISWGAAEVKVDAETGRVDLLRYVSLADVGKAINPELCLGQDEGAVMMAVGHTLHEEMIYRDGQLANPGLINYHVPNFRDIPEELHSVLVENHNGPGPYGSKGTGEGGLLPVAAAVANAVEDATGLRLYDLPLTPERVWRAISSKDEG